MGREPVGMKWLVLVIWFFGTSILIGQLMARHSLPFNPAPGLEHAGQFFAEKIQKESMLDGGRGRASAEFFAVHILDERCTCSDNVLHELIEGGFNGVQNIVISVSPLRAETANRLQQAGVKVEQIGLGEAKTQFGIESVPWFLILDRTLQIRYSGGYSRTKVRGRGDLEMNRILSEIKSLHDGRRPASRPTYGCVTSEDLRRRLLQFN